MFHSDFCYLIVRFVGRLENDDCAFCVWASFFFFFFKPIIHKMLIHPDDITGHHIHKLGPKGCESGPNFPSSSVGRMSRLAQREPGSGKLRLN